MDKTLKISYLRNSMAVSDSSRNAEKSTKTHRKTGSNREAKFFEVVIFPAPGRAHDGLNPGFGVFSPPWSSIGEAQ